MRDGKTLTMRLRRGEALTLADLVRQLTEMIAEPGDTDPAIARLTPDAYPDDHEAAREFRHATRGDLLDRRTEDARLMTATLGSAVDRSAPDEAVCVVSLAPPEVAAWMRTLTALRLVLATRLGIRDEDDGDRADPLFGVYDWLGLRLEILIADDAE